LSVAPTPAFANACSVTFVSFGPKSLLSRTGSLNCGVCVCFDETVTDVSNTADPCRPVENLPDAPPDSSAVTSAFGTNTIGPTMMGARFSEASSIFFSY
jgi:hypothetical protein